MSRRDADPDGAFIAGLVFLALFGIFFVLWKAFTLVAGAGARNPTNPFWWLLLLLSIVFTASAIGDNGDAVLVFLAMVSWGAFLVLSALAIRQAERKAGEPAKLSDSIQNPWWD
jgi:hypothetical protein